MAETTRLIFESLLRLHPHDYELSQLGLYHCYAVSEPRWPIYATETIRHADNELDFAPDDRYGEQTFKRLTQAIQPDIVFGFNDPCKLYYLCIPPNKRSYKLVLYTNIDGYVQSSNDISRLLSSDLIFTNSHFAAKIAKFICGDVLSNKIHYLYSPADINRFTLVSEQVKVELRRDLLPAWMPQNAFVLGWVGRNQWRKQVWLLYKVMHYLRTGEYLQCSTCNRISLMPCVLMRKRHLYYENTIMESRPGYRYDHCAWCNSPKVYLAEPLKDIYLWLHMPTDDPLGEWPLEWIERQFRLQEGRDIYYTEGCGFKKSLAPADMPMLYQIWDALLYLSGGEGFGLPAWEAMCCGLPVVYSNYSSHAEFLNAAHAGLPVDGILQPETRTCIWRMIPDVSQVIEAVRKLYFNREMCIRLGRNGRAFVQQYTPEIQAKKWHRIFKNLMAGEFNAITS